MLSGSLQQESYNIKTLDTFGNCQRPVFSKSNSFCGTLLLSQKVTSEGVPLKHQHVKS